jgi:hypothetical protein
MAWILLEGLDRSGKSTVSELYKKKGYKVVHLSAPDKKYYEQKYSGPSYLEEMVDLYMAYDGKSVVFDRSIYGELVWSTIYGRTPLLSHDDIEYLQQLESNNDTSKILMTDDNKEAHWQRCVDNKEPLDRRQFIQASRLYEEIAGTYGFEKRRLSDYVSPIVPAVDGSDGSSVKIGDALHADKAQNNDAALDNKSAIFENKLEKANAIRDILSGPIIKKKGAIFNRLNDDVRGFLQKELENIFVEKKQENFTDDEVKILKIYAQRIKSKMDSA